MTGVCADFPTSTAPKVTLPGWAVKSHGGGTMPCAVRCSVCVGAVESSESTRSCALAAPAAGGWKSTCTLTSIPTAMVSGIEGGAGSEKPGEPDGPRIALTVQSEYP